MLNPNLEAELDRLNAELAAEAERYEGDFSICDEEIASEKECGDFAFACPHEEECDGACIYT